MLPINSKPLIQFAIEEAISAGAFEMIYIMSKFKESIRQYLEPHFELNRLLSESSKEYLLDELNALINKCDNSFVYQDKMLGLGHAILQSQNEVGDNPFSVILPDDLCFNEEDTVLYQLKKVFAKHQDKCIIAIEEVEIKDVHKYGIIRGSQLKDETNIFLVDEMIEKPNKEDAPSNLAVIGRYILLPEIFKILNKVNPDSRGEIQITDALNKMAIQGKVLACKFDGKRIDCGSVEGFIEANNFFYRIDKN